MRRKRIKRIKKNNTFWILTDIILFVVDLLDLTLFEKYIAGSVACKNVSSSFFIICFYSICLLYNNILLRVTCLLGTDDATVRIARVIVATNRRRRVLRDGWYCLTWPNRVCVFILFTWYKKVVVTSLTVIVWRRLTCTKTNTRHWTRLETDSI